MKSVKEMEALLKQEEYKCVLYKFEKSELRRIGTSWEAIKGDYYEAQNCNGITEHGDLLDNLVKELGTLPTQTLYIERGMEIAEKWWKRNKRSKWGIGQSLQYKYRLSTSYISHVLEKHTILSLKELYPEAKIVFHDFIDYAGVDLVFADKEYDKKYYIHILKDSRQSLEWLKKKESRHNIKVNGQWERYERDFSGHCHFLYENDSDNCNVVNGIPFFTKEYLQDMIESERQQEREKYRQKDGQLEQLHKWLRKKKAVEDDFKFSSI